MGKPWEILHGDVRRVCKTLEPNSFDALIADPPYGLSFMGKRWDYFLPSVNVWTELLRVIKPGAHAMLFGGSRTFHRLAVSVEDAGFELRDTLMWMYGSGFPKSLDVSKAVDKMSGHWRGRAGDVASSNVAMEHPNYGRTKKGRPITAAAAATWDGYGTALKPAYEPIILARKPLEGTVAANVTKWGTGALAIDACRIGTTGGTAGRDYAKTGLFGMGGKATIERLDAGRWPANVILDEAGAMLDAQSGNRPGMSGGGKHRADYTGGMFGGIDSTHTARGDSGGASRFFYTPKADRYQREAGLDGMKRHKPTHGKDNAGGGLSVSGSVNESANNHPTVKPIDLIRYLARMILPPKRGTPRRILVPFSGSGSEIIGCLQAGWEEVVGIEREAEYIEIAKARITKGGVFSKLVREKRR